MITPATLRPPIRARVITVSDRCARGETADTSGPAIAALLETRLGAVVGPGVIAPDSIPDITSALLHAITDGVELIITTGGTGCTARDVTPEATTPLIDRPVPGIPELIRSSGAAHTPHAWLSRGVAGITRGSLLVNLPGSRAGATESLEAIFPLLPHAIELLRGGSVHPAQDRDR